jgi:hypothetical protein
MCNLLLAELLTKSRKKENMEKEREAEGKK